MSAATETDLSPRTTPAAQGATWRRLRPGVLTAAGLAMALAFLWPYLVMLLDAFRPSSDVVQTPAVRPPARVEVDDLRRGAGRRALPRLAADVGDRGRRVDGHRRRRRRAGGLLHGALPVPRAHRRSCSSCWSPRCSRRPRSWSASTASSSSSTSSTPTWRSSSPTRRSTWPSRSGSCTASSPRSPREVEEAAELDGCGRFGTLRRVMLPLTLPGLVTATIFTFIAAWNEYVVALTLMLDDAKKPLTVGHQLLRHRLRAELGPALRRLDHRDRARRHPVRRSSRSTSSAGSPRLRSSDRAPPGRTLDRGARWSALLEPAGRARPALASPRSSTSLGRLRGHGAPRLR